MEQRRIGNNRSVFPADDREGKGGLHPLAIEAAGKIMEVAPAGKLVGSYEVEGGTSRKP